MRNAVTAQAIMLHRPEITVDITSTQASLGRADVCGAIARSAIVAENVQSAQHHYTARAKGSWRL